MILNEPLTSTERFVSVTSSVNFLNLICINAQLSTFHFTIRTDSNSLAVTQFCTRNHVVLSISQVINVFVVRPLGAQSWPEEPKCQAGHTRET